MTVFGYLTIDLENKKITSIDKTYTGELVIDKIYGEKEILTIGEYACSNGKISSLDLSSTSITLIQQCAFLCCANLKTVKLPKSLETLKMNSFGLTGLTEFHLPENVRSFGGYAVNQAPNLNTLTVDENNPNYASYKNFIFSKDFTKLVRTPHNFRYSDIPLIEGIKQINYYSMTGCNLKAFVATRNISKLEAESFHACWSLKYVDLSLSSLKILPSGLFWGTCNIETLILPSKLEQLSTRSIESMNKLKELIIPETVNLISINTTCELSAIREIYVLGSFYNGFDDKNIFNGFSDKGLRVKVHVSKSYECDKFAGFTVTKDLYSALQIRMMRKLICTKLRSRDHALKHSVLFYLIINRS